MTNNTEAALEGMSGWETPAGENRDLLMVNPEKRELSIGYPIIPEPITVPVSQTFRAVTVHLFKILYKNKFNS